METLRRNTLYPLIDWLPNIPANERRNYMARWTGEYRSPKKGEWYLSGAMIGAYRMPNDGLVTRHIAEIVRVEHVAVVVGVINA